MATKKGPSSARGSGSVKQNVTGRSGKNRVNVAEAKASPAPRGPLPAQELVERIKRKDGQDLNAAQRKSLFRDCEVLIDKHLEGFVAVGIALRIIRAEKLYKTLKYDTFEAYCADRWGFGRARASQLISAAGVVEGVNSCKQIARLPSNEAQVRPLVKLDIEQQIAVWKRVVKRVNEGELITAKMVEEAVAGKGSTGIAQPDGDSSTTGVTDESDNEQAAAPSILMGTLAQLSILLKELPGQISNAAVEDINPALEALKMLPKPIALCIKQLKEQLKFEADKQKAAEDAEAT